MTSARLRVTQAGPHVTLQDAGRRGNMRHGVPASGPMDRLAHAAANAVIGNATTATAIEVSLAGLALECVDGPVTVSVVGGDFVVEHGNTTTSPWMVLTLRSGQTLSIRGGAAGSWTYLAVAGELMADSWLGHTATHSLSNLGGGQLRTGQELVIDQARGEAQRSGEVPRPSFSQPAMRTRVVLGPQDHHFQDAALSSFTTAGYAFTSAYDRMGVRLAGPPLELRAALSIPSEPIVRGSLQVAGDGVPTLLFADHQTTGGYPKIATVISADLDGLTQLRAGDTVGFSAVSPREAIAIARARAFEVDRYLAQLAGPGRTLAHRLMNENLIGTLESLDND